MKIIVDIGGCDNPHKMLGGTIDAAKAYPKYDFVVVGLKEHFDGYNGSLDLPNIKIEYATEVISNDESPTQAIRQKKDSTLIKAISLVKEDDSIGLVSGGSTGAVLTAATLLVGRLKGVHRPVLAGLMPTAIDGKLVCIADSGANVDAKPEYLAQFAVMANLYIQATLGIKEPVIGLLSVGTEEHKGDERTKAAFPLLKALPINFVGNLEARDALTGEYDIIICDGFSGNVLVKSTEGTAKMVMGRLKTAIKSSLKSKIGALMMKKSLKSLKSAMDYHSYGGAPFLGVKKPIVKTHGSSNELSTRVSIENIIRMYEHDIISAIERGVSVENESAEALR